VENAVEKVEVNYIGKTLRPAGQNWSGVVISQKYINDGEMLLVYFDNKFCCNAEACRIIEDVVEEEKDEIREAPIGLDKGEGGDDDSKEGDSLGDSGEPHGPTGSLEGDGEGESSGESSGGEENLHSAEECDGKEGGLN
jgi:hypothetical protein